MSSPWIGFWEDVFHGCRLRNESRGENAGTSFLRGCEWPPYWRLGGHERHCGSFCGVVTLYLPCRVGWIGACPLVSTFVAHFNKDKSIKALLIGGCLEYRRTILWAWFCSYYVNNKLSHIIRGSESSSTRFDSLLWSQTKLKVSDDLKGYWIQKTV